MKSNNIFYLYKSFTMNVHNNILYKSSVNVRNNILYKSGMSRMMNGKYLETDCGFVKDITK